MGCLFGSGKRAPTLDHVVPRSRGGRSIVDNLRLACAKCNALKGNRTAEKFMVSRRLSRRQDSVQRERALESGALIPKKFFHHENLVWFDEGHWSCSDCGQGSRITSPTHVVCHAQRRKREAQARSQTATPQNGYVKPSAIASSQVVASSTSSQSLNALS